MKGTGLSLDSDCTSPDKVAKDKAAKNNNSRPVDSRKSPFVGPMSPPLMCHASPSLDFRKSPFLGPQSPPLKSKASPVLDAPISPLLECQTPPACERQIRDETPLPDADEQADTCDVKVEAVQTVPCQIPRGAPRAQLDLSPNIASKVSNVKGHRDLLFIEDVKFASVETEASEQLQGLLGSVKTLWKEVHFGGDCLEFMAKDSGLKLTLLVQVEPSSDNTQECGSISLVGFLVYKLHPQKKYLSIRRVAVSPAFRRQGHAAGLMNWCVRVPGIAYLALTSTARALPFYRAFGFRKVETWHTGGTAHPDDEVEIGQVYMEYRPSMRRKAKK